MQNSQFVSILVPRFDYQFRVQRIIQETKQSHILLFSFISIFKNIVTRGEMQLDRQFALCLAAVECSDYAVIRTQLQGVVLIFQY